VGALARAVSRGDVKAAAQTLARLAQLAQAGELGSDDVTELAATLSAIAELDRAADSQLVESLHGAQRALGAGDLAGAARAMTEASSRFESLRPALAAREAAASADRLAQLLERAARDVGEKGKGEGEHGKTLSASLVGEAGESGSADRGTQKATEHAPGVRPEETNGPQLSIAAEWHGKLFKQVIDTAGAGGRADQLKESFAEHQRVVEDRFRHDEIPEEYAEAVRTYFAQLNQREHAWTSTRK
jgi:hypothetical protein